MMDYSKHVDALSYAHGEPDGCANLKAQVEDFRVNEVLPFEPSDEGEHEFLYVQKTGLNTEDVVKRLARHADVPRRSVSFAGMKDRQAITKQWFSVQLPGKVGPDWSLLNDAELNIENVTRHLKKLKRGSIKHNEFEITLSQLDADKALIEARVELIKQEGVPNYFMQQRFGYQCQNLRRAYELFEKKETMRNKKLRSLFLSSARSYLFNQVLSRRVGDKSWDKGLEGEVFILNGTRQFFQHDGLDEGITERLLEHDIHCSGPLFGIDDSPTSGLVKVLEDNIFSGNGVFCDGLSRAKMESSRRALRVIPQQMSVQWLAPDCLRLTFNLASGCYATAVIRELVKVATN